MASPLTGDGRPNGDRRARAARGRRPAHHPARGGRPAGVLAIVIVGLSWAKWWPYAHRIDVITDTDSMVILGDALSWRVTVAMAGAVSLTGLLGAASLTLLGG